MPDHHFLKKLLRDTKFGGSLADSVVFFNWLKLSQSRGVNNRTSGRSGSSRLAGVEDHVKCLQGALKPEIVSIPLINVHCILT